MGWSVTLMKDGEAVNVPTHSEGSNSAFGGTCTANINVTYNYSEFYRKHLGKDSLRWLNGKTGKQTTKKLRQAIEVLGIEKAGSYWDATPGNAGYILFILLSWALLHPDATFNIS